MPDKYKGAEIIHLETGIVKFPPKIHSIQVEKSDATGYTTITAKQNDTVLRFVIDEDACHHLARLLVSENQTEQKGGRM